MNGECRWGCSAEHKCSYHDGFQYPFPEHISQRLEKCLSFGNTGIVELIPPGKYVKKSPHPQDCTDSRARQAEQILREVQIYKSLPCHERLINMIEYSDNGLDSSITLDYLPNGSLDCYLESTAEITYRQQLQWCLQAAEGVALLHSYGIIHSDIKPQNMLLDDNMCVRIIDLSGASINNESPLSFESTRYFLPRSLEPSMPSSITTDIFALGSSLYHIMQRSQPYADVQSNDVEQRYSQKIFPTVSNVPCGDIILKCWTGQYTSTDSIVSALKCRLVEEEKPPSVWLTFCKGFSTLLPSLGTWYRKAMLAFVTFVGRPMFSCHSK